MKKKDSKMYDGVEFALYTYAPNRHQEQFLDASIAYYKQYTAMFGAYPFDSFRIVENFFDTGFGMPGYTLLSGALLQMLWVARSTGERMPLLLSMTRKKAIPADFNENRKYRFSFFVYKQISGA